VAVTSSVEVGVTGARHGDALHRGRRRGVGGGEAVGRRALPMACTRSEGVVC
jgi:hypothetical protein